MPIDRAACLACRHTVDTAMVNRLASLMSQLHERDTDVLRRSDVDPEQYDALFRAAVERLRGSFAATTQPKRRFIEAILGEMQRLGAISDWQSIGASGRLDYRVSMPSGRQIAIEGKGCPDGNNMNIWEPQSWADEIVVWSQCPESLANDPGVGVWSGIAIRLVPESVARNKTVDALIFFDGRCGSVNRRCPKGYGLIGGLRAEGTDIPGQRPDWMPPPCVYIFPRTVAHPYQNPSPPLHDLSSCEFPAALLGCFGVPPDRQRHEVHWVRVSAEARPNGTYLRIEVGWGLDNPNPNVDSGWKKLRR